MKTRVSGVKTCVSTWNELVENFYIQILPALPMQKFNIAFTESGSRHGRIQLKECGIITKIKTLLIVILFSK